MHLGYILVATLIASIVVVLLPWIAERLTPKSPIMRGEEFRKWIHGKDYISRPLRPSRAKKRVQNEQ